MNLQGPNGIEWVNYRREDGSMRYGYTLNPLPGCLHGCKWHMPDGNVAQCYAKTVAEKFQSPKFFPDGFETPGWFGNRLEEPAKVEEPARIFIDSMGDLMGRWVTDWHIQQVLDMCRRAHWHTFLILTKNPKRLLDWSFPTNVHVGVSMPADEMNGQVLTDRQKGRWLEKALEVLEEVDALYRWMSFEPLSWDVSNVVDGWQDSDSQSGLNYLDWAVIGAASNGPKIYQPDPEHVSKLIRVLDKQGTKIFFKGNLKGNPAAVPWREEYPA